MGAQDVTVGDVLKALERIEIWIRDIRGVLAQLDARQPLRSTAMAAAAPPQAQGSCPPPPPPDDEGAGHA